MYSKHLCRKHRWSQYTFPCRAGIARPTTHTAEDKMDDICLSLLVHIYSMDFELIYAKLVAWSQVQKLWQKSCCGF